ALAVAQFASSQILFSNGNSIGAPSGRAPGGFIAQPNRSDRDADFEADQVPALVHARVAPRGIGLDAVLAEAAPDVLALAFEHHEHAEADVIGNRRAIRAQRGDDFHLSLVMQRAAFGARAHPRRNLVH